MILYVSPFLVGKKWKITSNTCLSQQMPMLLNDRHDLVTDRTKRGYADRSLHPLRLVLLSKKYVPRVVPGSLERSTH